MTDWNQEGRPPFRNSRSPVRELPVLLTGIVMAVAIAFIGAAINFNEWLSRFFQPHASSPWVQFTTNFLVVWLITLLAILYGRWRRALRRSGELEDIISSINPDVLLIVDRDRHIRMANASLPRMFGYRFEEVTDRTTETLYFDRRSSPAAGHEIYEALEREGFHIGLATGRKKNGDLFPLEIITGLLKHHGGSVLLLRDISERKRAEESLRRSEEQLRQSQKMEAVGRLASGVAHDFNNLLTTILGFSNLALEQLPADHPVRPDLEEVARGAQRATHLTGQLLAFGRKEALQLRPVDLNAVLLDMDPMLRRTLGEDISLVTIPGEDVGSIESDPGGLEQVILNLAVNARDAMPQGGKLVIQSERVELSAEQRRALGPGPTGPHAMLLVRDTGSGMTREVRERAFEPFFTTKKTGKGTGLGLSTVYRIVSQSHGCIELNSEPGQGTEFRLYFPRLAEAASETAGTAAAPLPRGRETILVVEDEHAVRGFAVRVLRSLGYDVLEARNEADALVICERRREPIHLVLTDVVMPHVSGASLVSHMRQIRTDFRVLYASGFPPESVREHGVAAEEGIALIDKPYTRETLAAKVRDVLDAP
jgi:PAS domain S-box-containing protein